ncbi:hypothetical protein EAH78_18425 [Pseudomonas arsenicoxydans]|uniref:DUF1351 domain-containing protein n=1 Tax=Pseudomonas arsenicoxydans TaxID=702115 RepID=A0A502HNQ0_9PSED|nr:hypothetical protein EAH78_18425 [Pseudomonas arsenicoxydans]
MAEYKPLAKAMQDLQIRFKDVVFDCATPRGLGDAKSARAEIREVRYAIQNAEKSVLVPYQEAVKAAQARVTEVKQFGEDLKTKVLALEEPIDEKIKAKEKADKEEKARKEELERVRIENIQTKLSRFRGVASAYAARSSEDIATILESVKASVIDPDEYGEFEGEATIARDTAIGSLETLHTLAVTREAADAKAKKDAADLEELRQRQQRLDDEAAEQRRIQAKRDQDELDRQRDELKAQQKKLDDQAAQNQRDQDELARLRAQAAAPATAVLDPAPIEYVAPVALELPEAQPCTTTTTTDFGITMTEIVDVVAVSFDLSNDEAEALIRRLFA